MHSYFIKTPRLVKRLFPAYVWSLPTTEHAAYLTFDDGPHPQITPWVLDELKKYNAKATFFCVGKNVQQYPEVFARILAEGHAVGNHTQNHLNGWKVPVKAYVADVTEAAQYIPSHLFRPPYGRIKAAQARQIKKALKENTKVVMWDVLSADFDQSISKEKCLTNVLYNTREGSVIVFHDSEKAEANLRFALPLVLEELSRKHYKLKRIE